MKKLISFVFLLFLSGSILAQDLDQVRTDILGTWRLDMDRTREEYQQLKKHISNKRVKLFEEFLLYYEVYQWTFKEDMMSISFKANGQNFPSQNAKWTLKKENFTKDEEAWIGRSPLFNPWATQEQAVWITAKKQGRQIIKLTSTELIVWDEGTPLVFGKVE